MDCSTWTVVMAFGQSEAVYLPENGLACSVCFYSRQASHCTQKTVLHTADRLHTAYRRLYCTQQTGFKLHTEDCTAHSTQCTLHTADRLHSAHSAHCTQKTGFTVHTADRLHSAHSAHCIQQTGFTLHTADCNAHTGGTT